MSAYSNNSKKISQFTKGTAITNDVQYSSLQGGINKTFTQQQIINDFQDVYGASLRTFEFESQLVASDIALGEYAIVEGNRYSLYKITNDAVTNPNIGLTSGLTATREAVLQDNDFDDVEDMKTGALLSGDIATTGGYYSKGGDGAAIYLIKTAAEASADGDVIDGYGNHTLTNGNVAILQIGEKIIGETFGVDNTGADDSLAAIQAACALSAGSKAIVLSGRVKFSSHLTGYSKIVIELANNTVILSDSADQWILDCPELTVIAGSGCSIGETGSLFNDYIIRYSSGSIDSLYITSNGSPLNFVGDTTTERLISCAGGTSSTKINISNCILDGFTRSGIELPVESSSDDSQVIIDSCVAINASNQSGTRRGIQVGDNPYKSQSVSVTRCKVNGLGGSGTNEVKGIIVYANSIFIDGNEVRDIINTGSDDAEGIYVKANYGSISNNVLVNAGSSHDGCITTKGLSWSTDSTYSDFLTVSGNTITLTDADHDIPGMSINTNNTIVSNNTLLDLRSSRASLDHSIAIGLGASNYVNNCIVESNVVTGWKYFIGSPLSESNHARLVNNISIKNNTCTQMAATPAITWRPDNKITDTFSFVASTNTISIDNDSQEFTFYSFEAGDDVEFFGTSSNDQVFTIASVSQYSITVTSGVTDEANESAQMIKSLSKPLKITGNTFHTTVGSGSAIRQRARKNESITFDGNTFLNYTNAYEMEITNCADTLIVGSGECYEGISGSPFTSAVEGNVTDLEAGLVTSISTGANTTANGTLEVTDRLGNVRYVLTAASA
jgi:hypothetical protein